MTAPSRRGARLARRAPLVVAAALAVLLPLGGPAEAILVASPNIPPSDTTLLVQRDSAQYTFAGQAGTVSDASSAPVDVSISFP